MKQDEIKSNTTADKKLSSKQRRLLFAGGIFILLVIILTLLLTNPVQKIMEADKASVGIKSGTNQNQQDSQGNPDGSQLQSSATLIYGTWSGQTSVIKSYDLSSQTSTELASLPSAIKKVTVLSPQSLLYIDQTDSRDHGKQLVIHDIKTKKIIATIPAANGFGIDDYFISPNKEYIATWEVSFAPDSQVLYGGKSRVYAVKLSNPTVKNLLYDEVANTPVHYPRAVLDNGTVFADSFLPNDPNGSTGWAYGMSVSDFEGKNKRDLENMQQGTYGTQPSLSPDGKYLVFAGYDGSKGDGNALVDGYRRAILSPNTIELLDTTTFNRQKLTNFSPSNVYAAAVWDEVSGTIITTIIPPKKEEAGVYTYNPSTQSLKKINLPSSETTTSTILSLLPSDYVLSGNIDDRDESLGNLGETYAPSLQQLYTLNPQTPNAAPLAIQEPLVQYITTLPANYFQGVLGTKDGHLNPQPTLIDLYSDKNSTKERLQLYTFFIKADLDKTRQTQQSRALPTPASQHISLTIPTGTHQTGTITFPSGTYTVPSGVHPPTTKKDKTDLPKCKSLAIQQCGGKEDIGCVNSKRAVNKVNGECHDSPLYLYGPVGQQVSVWIQTPISNAIPSSSGTYDVTLGDNGNFSINGKTYPSISYDYISNMKRIVRPTKGTFAKRADAEKVLRQYAQKMGLNERETSDLVRDGKAKVTAPYVFISFFDQETSEQILPISFTPKPDNYLNIVFYIKNLASLPDYTPAAPDFPAPIKRTGFTAVEISEMAE